MSDNKITELETIIKDITKDIPNLIIPTMGIIEQENKIKLNNQEYLNNAVKEEKNVK